MPGFDNDNVFFGGIDTRGVKPIVNQMTTNGQLLIGSTAAPNIRVGSLTSTGGTLTISTGAGTINLETTGGAATTNLNVDTNTPPGTDPVVPNGSGTITVTGAQVAAGTVGANVIRTDSLAANTMTIEIQRSTAVGATASVNNGVCHFDSGDFTVDANGFVQASGTGVGQTITGDSGGALSPTAGNWNILGRSGSKTSGSGSTLTVKSPTYADAGGSATSTLNSGSFVTGAFTLTLPVSAGLADGDLFEYVATSAAAMVIQAVGAQRIRLGIQLSSVAGTLTSTAIGDAIILRFRATDGFFYATSSIGNWTVA